MFSCLHSLVKIEGNVWENSRADQLHLRFFTSLRESFHIFQQAMMAKRTYFISFIKLLPFRNKEKGNIRSAYVSNNFFRETLNSHNLAPANHIALFIFVLHSAVKTHL